MSPMQPIKPLPNALAWVKKTVWRVLHKIDRQKDRVRRVDFRPHDAFTVNVWYLREVDFYNVSRRYKIGITSRELKRRFKKDLQTFIRQYTPISLWYGYPFH